jgi:3-deoxy-D-manno-octulosonate 8-phosphate phosphatase (KDO 8-P phosphatase)
MRLYGRRHRRPAGAARPVREACEFLLDARGALDDLLQDCLR